MSVEPLHTDHARLYASNRYVYPVLSRRAGGLSIGVNLNPDKICNFDCIYCQVNRRTESETRFVDLATLLSELEATLAMAVSGEIYQSAKLRATPPALRRLNDIAFSGDGEPTAYRNFDELVAACAAVKRRLGLAAVKLVLITNSSLFHRPHVQRGLAILDANQGEIWAKLDAGTEAYFQAIDRTSIPLSRILDNITTAAQIRPLVIQTLFMRVRASPPSDSELAAYCQRLNAIQAAGGRLSLIQIHTVARQPAESFVEPLRNSEVDAIVDLVRQRTGLPVNGYYGSS